MIMFLYLRMVSFEVHFVYGTVVIRNNPFLSY